uniref:DNA replication factor Cdt1 C-terminal domain-containing protein n=1 Tax=Sexangularia sp. CB-2014 TaxID=1486929 RepID=A0A7S1V5G7_9EUKA
MEIEAVDIALLLLLRSTEAVSLDRLALARTASATTTRSPSSTTSLATDPASPSSATTPAASPARARPRSARGGATRTLALLLTACQVAKDTYIFSYEPTTRTLSVRWPTVAGAVGHEARLLSRRRLLRLALLALVHQQHRAWLQERSLAAPDNDWHPDFALSSCTLPRVRLNEWSNTASAAAVTAYQADRVRDRTAGTLTSPGSPGAGSASLSLSSPAPRTPTARTRPTTMGGTKKNLFLARKEDAGNHSDDDAADVAARQVAEVRQAAAARAAKLASGREAGTLGAGSALVHRMPLACEALRALYHSSKRATLPLPQVQERLITALRPSVLNKADAAELVDHLCRAVPGWIEVLEPEEGTSGTFVRVEARQRITEVQAAASRYARGLCAAGAAPSPASPTRVATGGES